MESKVEFKYGSLRFSAEGEAKWVAGEFQKVINSLGKLGTAEPKPASKRTSKKAAEPAKPAAKRRGRPKGSTNKPKAAKTATATAAKPAAKRRGRPKGSTNKPKTTKAAPVAKKTRATRATKAKVAPKTAEKPTVSTKGLQTYLKKHNAVSNQTKRFLATAVFLTKGGAKVMTTRDITNALKDIGLPKLTNASQALKNNADKGYATKNGRQFTITKSGVDLFA